MKDDEIICRCEEVTYGEIKKHNDVNLAIEIWKSF